MMYLNDPTIDENIDLESHGSFEFGCGDVEVFAYYEACNDEWEAQDIRHCGQQIHQSDVDLIKTINADIANPEIWNDLVSQFEGNAVAR